MDTLIENMPSIEGEKGGGKGKGGGSGGKEKDNTLQSRARARFAEIISEGPIRGLVDGQKSIFFDETRLQNADNSLNFNGTYSEMRIGSPDQQHMPGLPLVETYAQVETQVKRETGPVTRAINEINADSCRIIVRFASLVQYDDKGGIKGTDAEYSIEVRPYNGLWTEVVRNRIDNEKTVSPWQIAHRFQLPASNSGWEVRVVNYRDQPKDSKTQRDLVFESYTSIVEGKFTYPNTAYIYHEINSEQFGTSLPTRSYDILGLIVRIPLNYDPDARSYSGMWSGAFKNGWTNNPAWVFYDLVTSDRYGLGEFVDSERIDKWTLYQIAQYCDEMVPSGFKDEQGNDILEPRFTFNGVINTREEAQSVLTNITNAFRGMAFWALGQVYAVADIPADPIKLVTAANTIDGKFTYSGTAKKSRHSVALVSWNDQTDNGRPAIEVVINQDALQEFGWREISITKHGCTSRGEAHRFGKWILDTERHETETIEYTAGWDHAELKPFDLIAVADPSKALVRAGGRLRPTIPNSRNSFILDADYKQQPDENLFISVTLPSGVVERVQIVARTPREDGTVLTTTVPLTASPVDNAVYVLSSVQVNPRQYRVLSVKESEETQFQVTALFHDPTKYARVEYDVILDPISYSRPGAIPLAPKNLTAVESQYVKDGVPHSKILFSWTPGSAFATRHSVTVSGPQGRQQFDNLVSPTIELNDTTVGLYKFQVRSYGNGNMASGTSELNYEAHGWTIDGDTLAVLDLKHISGTPFFNSRDCTIQWRNVVPGGATRWRSNIIEVYDARDNQLLMTEEMRAEIFAFTFDANVAHCAAGNKGPTRSLRFNVRVVDVDGNISQPSVVELLNPQVQTPLPRVQGGYYQAFITWDRPPDPDLAGTLIWVSRTKGFNPLYEKPEYDTQSNLVTIKTSFEGKYYIRTACYDSFGQDGLNISGEVEFDVLSDNVDVEEPMIPTGLTLTSELQGDGQARVNVEWDAHGDPLVVEYGLEIAFWDGNFVSIPTRGAFYTFVCMPGTRIRARLRAYKWRGVFSGYSPIVEIVAAADSEPPAVPANLAAVASFENIWLTWDRNTEEDMARWIVDVKLIRRGTDADEDGNVITVLAEGEEESTDHTGTYQATDNRFLLAAVGTGDTYEFKVSAVDTSGNDSGFCEPVQATTLFVRYIDMDKEMADLAMPVNELPDPITDATPQKVFLKTDKKFYVQNVGTDGERTWVLQTAAELITGKIVTEQIADLAITTDLVDMGAIGNTEIDNLSISTPKLRSESIDARKIRAGAIEADKIAANAVTAGKIAANAVTAREIQAETITSNEIKSRSIVANDIEARSLTAAEIAVGALGADVIAANAITAEKIGANAVLARNIKANEINANHLTTSELITLSAQIKDGIIDNAKIANLDAGKLNANSILSGQIKVDGTTLSSVRNDAAVGAQNPATRINNGFTTIDAGRVTIAGSTTLANWRDGGDVTKISGGSISANSIATNKIKIGSRGITVEGVDFYYDRNTGYVRWSDGYLNYIGDHGGPMRTYISAGQYYTNTTGRCYIYWAKGASSLTGVAQTSWQQSLNEEVVHMAAYGSNMGLQVLYGGTIIDGTRIVTGTVQAQQIAAGAITADKISVTSLQALGIKVRNIDMDDATLAGEKLVNGAITDVFVAVNSLQIGYNGRSQIAGRGMNIAPFERVLISAGYSAYGPVDFTSEIGFMGHLTIALNGGDHVILPVTGPCVDSFFCSTGALTYVWQNGGAPQYVGFEAIMQLGSGGALRRGNSNEGRGRNPLTVSTGYISIMKLRK